VHTRGSCVNERSSCWRKSELSWSVTYLPICCEHEH
jgi:hypothetical protein